MSDHNRPEEQEPDRSTEPEAPPERPGLLQVLASVLAALFGVQSGRNRARDFQRGDPRDYILVFTLAVAALVIGMILLVRAIV